MEGLSLLDKFGLGFEFLDWGAPARDGRCPRGRGFLKLQIQHSVESQSSIGTSNFINTSLTPKFWLSSKYIPLCTDRPCFEGRNGKQSPSCVFNLQADSC
jgi:hypothetical protein